ncbi:hypothetical protein IMG5_171460 [Ichthyophthirius multifiliis]|uniref:Uncharacterized protein n=1 Tax=Ichthyophthirius multifiliis TaxID=5932 RepID=G0R1M5_ICHMU|nr:hypothetical protein IMG5_171460 [Ichthyophthirius multifiliis]EGR28635.1 hypothetical protein IMG5_171460 [Ichthyophthirius multifiliis]|eukprot:XP_004029871.1 hypothetical protein IMG5_171460 [Ichthyophthirius multifiliis]
MQKGQPTLNNSILIQIENTFLFPFINVFLSQNLNLKNPFLTIYNIEMFFLFSISFSSLLSFCRIFIYSLTSLAVSLSFVFSGIFSSSSFLKYSLPYQIWASNFLSIENIKAYPQSILISSFISFYKASSETKISNFSFEDGISNILLSSSVQIQSLFFYQEKKDYKWIQYIKKSDIIRSFFTFLPQKCWFQNSLYIQMYQQSLKQVKFSSFLGIFSSIITFWDETTESSGKYFYVQSFVDQKNFSESKFLNISSIQIIIFSIFYNINYEFYSFPIIKYSLWTQFLNEKAISSLYQYHFFNASRMSVLSKFTLKTSLYPSSNTSGQVLVLLFNVYFYSWISLYKISEREISWSGNSLLKKESVQTNNKCFLSQLWLAFWMFWIYSYRLLIVYSIRDEGFWD